MANSQLSSSYPSAFRSRTLDDITKSRLGGDILAESWPNGFPKDRIDDLSQNSDLPSLAWLQKDCLLNIAPLDHDDDVKPRPHANNSSSTSSSLNDFSHLPVGLIKDRGVLPPQQKQTNSTKPDSRYPYTHGRVKPPGSGHHYFSDSNGARVFGSGNGQASGRPPKPAYSYTHLIFMAIESAAHKCRTVNQIYNWCESHFPYFRTAGPGWKNSLRHNLSINKCFKRIPRDGRTESKDGCEHEIEYSDTSDSNSDDEAEGPGRGAYWTVEEIERPQLLEAVKRNPWTYSAGLPFPLGAGIPLHSSGPPFVGARPGNDAGCHSSSEEPVSSTPCSSASSTVEEEDELAQYASMLRHLHSTTTNGGSNGVRKHRHHPCSKAREDRDRLPNGRRSPTASASDTELKLARLPSESVMPLLHRTMKKLIMGERRGHSDDDRRGLKRSSETSALSTRPRRRRSRSPVTSSIPLDSSMGSGSSFSSLGRRRVAGCIVTPAPSLEHEYARFQAQLHPPTHYSDHDDEVTDEETEEEEEMDDATEPMSMSAELDELEEMEMDTNVEIVGEQVEASEENAAKILVGIMKNRQAAEMMQQVVQDKPALEESPPHVDDMDEVVATVTEEVAN